MNGAIGMWQWINDNGTGLGGIAAVVTAVIAVAALRSTARDSRDRSRPVVVPEFVMAENSDSTIDLRLRNYGQTVADDLRVSFDPPLPEVPASERLVTRFLKQRYDRTIAHLSPGQEFRNIWWIGHATAGEMLRNGEPTPDRVRVTVTYKGTTRKPYREAYTLDVEDVTLETYSTSS
ncbi:MAG TPA: hypothetical protein VFO55_14755 [Gemmatimonadaceae bacterium]|nr:hypothetical protein [Gemmatimonadaceae bacterium]